MGTLTRSQLETEIKAFLGNRIDIDTRLVNILNLSQIRITRLKNWDELEEIASGTLAFTGANSDKFFSFPANIRDIRSFRLIDGTNSRKLKYVATNKMDTDIPYPEANARNKPKWYVVWKSRAELVPMPNKAYDYELRYSFWPTAFTSTSDVVSDLDNKDDLIILLSVSWIHLSIGNEDKANKYFAIFKNEANNAIGEQKLRPDLTIAAFSKDSEFSSSQPWANPFIKDL